MTVENQDIRMWQQETRNVLCTFRDENNALVDLASATITWIARQSTPNANVLSKTVGSGITVTGTGTFTIAFAQADTATLTESLALSDSTSALVVFESTVTDTLALIDAQVADGGSEITYSYCRGSSDRAVVIVSARPRLSALGSAAANLSVAGARAALRVRGSSQRTATWRGTPE